MCHVGKMFIWEYAGKGYVGKHLSGNRGATHPTCLLSGCGSTLVRAQVTSTVGLVQPVLNLVQVVLVQHRSE
jgi:hypothetical protein